LQAPEITDVDELTMSVKQAYYDASKKVLIVTISDGPVKAKTGSFVVRRMPAGHVYGVTSDGVVDLSASVQKKPDGSLLVSTSLDKSHSFVILSE
jgi:hypothetical protein